MKVPSGKCNLRKSPLPSAGAVRREAGGELAQELEAGKPAHYLDLAREWTPDSLEDDGRRGGTERGFRE